jgi:hypothetical protein
LWPERLYVSLEPDSLALCRGKLLSKKFVETDSPIEELKKHLNDYLKVTVVLSNRLVRYAIVPHDAAVSTPEEEQALARFHFTRIYGERAKAWELRLSESRLACAIDAELLKALRDCFPASSKARLVSVQPWLMAAYNHWKPGKQPAWLVLLERERACLALASPKAWQSVQSLRLQGEEELAELLEREALRAGDGAPRKAMVFGGRPAAPAGWQVSYSPLENPYSMALSALASHP